MDIHLDIYCMRSNYMKKYLITFLFLIYAANSWGWWNKTTHRVLAENAAKRYSSAIDPKYLDQPLKLQGKEQRATFLATRWCRL